MNILKNLRVDDEAKKQIEKCYLEARPQDDRVLVACLYYIVKATDPAGKPIRTFKLGYRLARMRLEDLETAKFFDMSGDGVYLAILFRDKYDPDAQYLLEYYDDVFYLLKQHESLEDQGLREIFQ